MSTLFLSNEAAQRGRKWWVVDATGVPVGRLASAVAGLIRGKHKPSFTPHNDCGDFVVVLNAAKIKFTGNKLEGKIYYDHTQHIGGLKTVKAGDLLKRNPNKVVEKAVRGMLPKNILGHRMRTKLKIFAGDQHPHGAQRPEVFQVKH